MDWKDIESKWMHFKGSAKQKWGKLTNDDLDYVAGTRDRLVGMLEKKYGLTRKEAERQTDDWFVNQRNPAA